MSFVDIRMPQRICEQFEGGPTFATTVTRARSGVAKANVDRPDVLFAYQATNFLKDFTLRQTMIAFYMALFGQGFTFRFRDIGHFWSGCEIYGGIGDIDPLDPADITPFATGTGSDFTFQLRVPYTFATYTTWRKVTKPCKWGVADTMNDNPGYTGPRFWVGTTPVNPANVSLDTSTGLATFTSAPANGAAIRCATLFDVHTRFEEDQLILKLLEGPEVANVVIRMMEELDA